MYLGAVQNPGVRGAHPAPGDLPGPPRGFPGCWARLAGLYRSPVRAKNTGKMRRDKNRWGFLKSRLGVPPGCKVMGEIPRRLFETVSQALDGAEICVVYLFS